MGGADAAARRRADPAGEEGVRREERARSSPAATPRAWRGRYASSPRRSRTSGSAARTARRSTMSRRTCGSSSPGGRPPGRRRWASTSCRSSRDQLKGKTLAIGAREDVRRESGRRPADVVRREAASAIRGAVVDRRRAEPRRPEGARARHRRLRDSFRGRRVLVEAANEGHPGAEEAAGGESCRRGSASRRSCAAQIEQRGARRAGQGGRRREGDQRDGPLRLQTGLQLAVRRRPAGARRQGDRPRSRSGSRRSGRRRGGSSRAMYAPTRWLLEIYPIDEILAARAEDRPQEDPVREDADRIAGLRSGRHGTRRRRAAAADVRAGDRRARRSSIGSRTTSACASRPAGSRPTSPAAPRSTSASRPIPSGSGIGSRRRRCRRSTTT